MHRKPNSRTAGSLATEFRLIGQAIAEAFRGMKSSARFDSRFNRLSCCGGAL
jgi:hypothetical protein